MNDSGYSGTPLAKKLGIKDHLTIKLVNAPDYYWSLFSDLPANITVVTSDIRKKDFIHYFETSASLLASKLLTLKGEITLSGVIWVSWYKKSAKMQTDVTEDIIRNTAMQMGLVDVKVCAIDERWSALKLVIPLKDR